MVPRGAISPHQLMQAGEKFTRVRHVTTHRRISPFTLAEAVETHVQKHQIRDIFNHGLRILQLPQPLTRHLCTHHLVVMETHASTGLFRPCSRLADVMQQRRPAQHQIGRLLVVFEINRLLQDGQGMLVDIFMLQVFIRLHG